MVVKFGRIGENVVLADFSSGISKTFNSSGRFIRDGFVGSPRLIPVSVISVTQFGSRALVYHEDTKQQKTVDGVIPILIKMRSVQGLMYPMITEGVTSKGLRYKQHIYCCSTDVDTLKVYNEL